MATARVRSTVLQLVASRHASTSTIASSSSGSSSSSSPSPPPPSAPATTRTSGSPSLLHETNLPTSPFQHHVPIKPIHNVHVATLHLRSHTTELDKLQFFTSFALRAAKALGLSTTGIASLPTKTSLYTVPKSPFAHKKSQQNFWKKQHKRCIKVFDGNQEIVKVWLGFLRKEAMGGVGQKAQLFEYKQVGWANQMMKDDETQLRRQLVKHDNTSTSTDRQHQQSQVQALAQEELERLTKQVQADEATQTEQLEQQATVERRQHDAEQVTTTTTTNGDDVPQQEESSKPVSGKQ
ncbi:mitochondrial 37S ribosomal protein rsm10 [Microbotryomycetes sp. JL221]|nr:mitochondrial 37S ribosomal protein rsm10 [Microbotryomycetes sp. JL221]